MPRGRPKKKKSLAELQTDAVTKAENPWDDVDDHLDAAPSTNDSEPAEQKSPGKKRRYVSKFEDRKEFDAEKYDVSATLTRSETAHSEAVIEQIEAEDLADVDKEAKDARKRWPSPKMNPIFRRKWNLFLPNVVARDNFQRGHLEALGVLCDLYVEYETLSEGLRRTGYTYILNTVLGAIPKPYPEVAQLNKVRGEIRNYSKMLGLLLYKDKHEKAPTDETWD